MSIYLSFSHRHRIDHLVESSLVPYKILIYEDEHDDEDEDEKNQIRSHAYALRLFLFSAFRIPNSNFRIPDT